jgi:hypothetical protein
MDDVMLRASERLLAVIIGGLGIFLGYRLFLRIPEQKAGEGKITFPGGASIFATRVGPGVFFAMFGAASVGVSLVKGIVASRPMPPGPSIYAGIVQGPPPRAPASNPLEQLQWRSHIEFLNVLPTWVTPDLGEAERREVGIRTEEIKLLLMDQAWGDRQAFRRWVESGASDPIPASLTTAAHHFRAGRASHEMDRRRHGRQQPRPGNLRSRRCQPIRLAVQRTPARTGDAAL